MIIGDLIAGVFLFLVLYKLFLWIGIGAEKRAEKMIEDVKHNRKEKKHEPGIEE